VELAGVNACDGLIKIVKMLGRLILIENFLVFRVHIVPLSKLKPVVFPNTVDLAVCGKVQRVLKPQTYLFKFNFK